MSAMLRRCAYEECYRVSSSVLQRDPFALQCLHLHLGAALQLGRKSDLFMLGHRLTEEHPDQVGGGEHPDQVGGESSQIRLGVLHGRKDQRSSAGGLVTKGRANGWVRGKG